MIGDIMVKGTVKHTVLIYCVGQLYHKRLSGILRKTKRKRSCHNIAFAKWS